LLISAKLGLWLRSNGAGLSCAAVFAMLYSAIGLFRYTHFIWSSWDLGIFTQIVSHYSQLQAPSVPIRGLGFTALGDHFSPALAVLAPPYALVPDPTTLLVAQALLLAWSIFPIHRLVSRRLGFWPGLAVTVAYAVSFGVLQAVLVDFHEVALGAPLMAFALEGLAERRWRQVVLASLPLVLVKEDLGVTVAAIGVVCALRGRRRLGALVAGFGLAASFVEVTYLIPALSSSANYAYFAQFGASEGGIRSLLGALSPDTVLRGGGEKIATLLKYTWATVGLCWFSSLSLVAVPTLVWRFASTNSSYWGTDWHYDLILMPVVFAAAIEVLSRLSASDSRVGRWYAQAVPLTLAAIAGTLLVASAAADVAHPAAWAQTPRQRALDAALQEIPAGAVVHTDLGLLSHLAGRTTVYWIGQSNAPLPGYVVTDEGAGWTPPPPEDQVAHLAEVYPGHTWGIVSASEGVVVLRLNS
jgi:uncharacterized membrane protein